MNTIDRYFGLSEKGTNLRTEFIGGLTTFLTMAYILFVNPTVLSETGMDKGALITATALASMIGTVLAGLWARVPFAMAPGMGLNAFFTYTLVLSEGLAWQTALAVVFLSGVLFLALSLFGFREKVAEVIPNSIKVATAGGIGLFISFIGFKNMGLIVDSPATLITLGDFSPEVLIGIGALLLILLLEAMRIKGGILIGILVATVAALSLGLAPMPDQWVDTPPSLAPIAFQLDLTAALKFSLLGSILSFMFVDLLDSIGTIVACSHEAKLVQPDGKIHRMGKVLSVDALATSIGALLGTSTTTTYIESGSGIAAGARTGLSSVFTALFFLLALFFAPLIGIVPAYATAPALVMVGIYMLKYIRDIEFDRLEESAPAFLTLLLMPLTHSISTGLSFGFISYLVLMSVTGKARDIPPLLWFIGLLALVNLLAKGH